MAATMKDKGRAHNCEPNGCADTLAMSAVRDDFQGACADSINLVNRICPANRLVRLELQSARPARGFEVLAIDMKLEPFFCCEGPAGNPGAEIAGFRGQPARAALAQPRAGGSAPLPGANAIQDRLVTVGEVRP